LDAAIFGLLVIGRPLTMVTAT